MSRIEIARYGYELCALYGGWVRLEDGIVLTFVTVDVPATTFAWRQFENTHVCHDQSVTGAFERDIDEFEVCYKGMF